MALAFTFALGLMLATLLILQPAHAAPQATTLFAIPGDIAFAACSSSQPCTLWRALDLATTGSTIYLAQGRYTRSGTDALVALDRSIRLYGGWTRSGLNRDPEGYPSILDGEQRRQVIVASGDVTPTLDGLHVTGGVGSVGGGGILAAGAYPVIRDCRVYSNAAPSGGGIALDNAPRAVLTGNHIYSNTATMNGGAILLNQSPDVTLDGNFVYGNKALLSGGGLVLYEGSNQVLLSGNTIYSNSAALQGGGVVVAASTAAVLTGNTIYSNTAGDYGGGLYLYQSNDPTLSGNTIYGNRGRSGGLRLADCSGARLEDNTIFGNSATGRGGGLALNDCDGAVIAGNAIFSNTAAIHGGGVYGTSSPGGVLSDTQLYGNTAENGAGLFWDNCDSFTLLAGRVVSNSTSNGRGGGIYLDGIDDAAISNSLIAFNRANGSAGHGGGLYLRDTGVRIVNSTVSHNRAGVDGGGVETEGTAGTVALLYATVYSNTASVRGGGVRIRGLELTLQNALLAGNAASEGPDGWGTLRSSNHNLIEQTGGLTVTGNTGHDIYSQAPRLGALGPAGTHPLHADSPAVDAALCLGDPATDQRGVTRPQGNGCDIGAHENNTIRLFLPLALRNA